MVILGARWLIGVYTRLRQEFIEHPPMSWHDHRAFGVEVIVWSTKTAVWDSVVWKINYVPLPHNGCYQKRTSSWCSPPGIHSCFLSQTCTTSSYFQISTYAQADRQPCHPSTKYQSFFKFPTLAAGSYYPFPTRAGSLTVVLDGHTSTSTTTTPPSCQRPGKCSVSYPLSPRYTYRRAGN